jgi:protein-tyrosine-phosphatase
MSAPQILIVCTANICRSPVVTALLQKRLKEGGYDDWGVDSAGTWAVITRGASRYSIQLMANQGIDITNHRAKMINERLIAQSDLVLCMELGHAEALHVEFRAHQDRIFLLSEMIGKRFSVNDPYGGSLDNYREMVTEVTRILDEGFERIVSLAEENYRQRNA